MVAYLPINMADGNTIEIPAKDLADFLGRIAVADLGGLAFDKSAVAAQLGHAGFE